MPTASAPSFDPLAVLEAIGDAFVAVDRTWRITAVNGALEHLLGQSRAQLLGAPLREAVPAAAVDPFAAACLRSLTEGVPEVFETAFPTAGRWASVRVAPVADGLAVFIRDITEHRQAAQARQREAMRFRTALRGAPIAVFAQDIDLRYTWIYSSTLGDASQTALGKRDAEMLERPEEAAATELLKRRVIETGIGRRDEVCIHVDGIPHSYDLIIEPLRDDAGHVSGISCAAIDVTARKAAEAERERLLAKVRLAEARYHGLFEGVSDCILVANADGRYVDANSAATRLLGYTREEFLRMSTADVMPMDAAEAMAMFAQFKESGVWFGEAEVRRKDGTLIPVEGRASVLETPEGPLYVAVSRDISERRELERQRHEFTAMITHDLKTPLTSIRAYAQLMRRRGDYSAQAVEAIEGQSKRMARLIDDLMEADRLAAGRLELEQQALDLAEVVAAAAEAAASLSTAHPIVLSLPPEPVLVRGDRDRLLQVLDNLLTNAVKYSPDGGEVTVTVTRIEGEARVAVRDQGLGIPAEVLPHLFDRFYRVGGARRSAGEGLGLGLAICKGLVEAHGGHIDVESTPGQGSTFWFSLPLA